MKYALDSALIVLVAGILAGCDCANPPLPVTMTPSIDQPGYEITGPYDLEGTLTHDASEWVLEGAFFFPNSGYELLSPNIEVEATNVDVDLRILLPAPAMAVLPVITERRFAYRIPAAEDAEFAIDVHEVCRTLFSGIPVGGEPRDLAVEPRTGGGYDVEGNRFSGMLVPLSDSNPTRWELEGLFTFPTGGYQVHTPEVQVAESFPEQVTIILGYTAPTGIVTQVITEVPVRVVVEPVSRDATFRVKVQARE